MAEPEEMIALDDPPVSVALRRSARARRFILRIVPGQEAPRLTAPGRAPRREIIAFLDRQRPWLRAALARRSAPRHVDAGVVLPVAGRGRRLVADPLIRRACRLEADRLITPPIGIGPAVAAFLREQARETLAAELRAAAGRIGAQCGRISFRDMRSRWGSCTARGDISLSWRLAMAPPEVAAYVARHEAAHLIEMNHGPRFWALVERLDPDWRGRRDWLKTGGAELLRWRF